MAMDSKRSYVSANYLPEHISKRNAKIKSERRARAKRRRRARAAECRLGHR
jgi:hypothetical protein